MNKHMLLTSVAALGVIFNLSAYASSSDDTEIEMKAEAEPVCFVASSSNDSVNFGFNIVSTGDEKTIVELNNFIDSQTAVLTPVVRFLTLTFSDVYCNYSHTLSIQVKNGGLINITPGAGAVAGSGNFVEHLNYTISAQLGGVASISMTTDGTPLDGVAYTPDIPGAFRGQLDVNITIPPLPASVPVLAGDYSDTATIKIGAGL